MVAFADSAIVRQHTGIDGLQPPVLCLRHALSSLGKANASLLRRRASKSSLRLVVSCALGLWRSRRGRRNKHGLPVLQATRVETTGAESEVPPWELDRETEEEREKRYEREAIEMRLKWEARRLEEKHSAQRRLAWAAKEREREQKLGPRDLIQEAREARIYEEAR
eukprot:1896990-Amphidinium_carterae.1